MRVLLTGGCGDLGRVLSSKLDKRSDVPVNLDVTSPMETIGEYIHGSVLDRKLLEAVVPSVDCVVHIAAWHGIHEFRKEKDAFDFWELNVTGTFTLLECCARAGIKKLVFISSTSVDEWPGIYAHSKLVAEDLMRTYVARHGMDIISLRTRAFIPHWNRKVYANISEWAQWYWKGAVHINDVAQAVLKSIDLLHAKTGETYPPFIIDGACDFSAEELSNWDANGAGSTFRSRFGEELFKLAVDNGVAPDHKPKILGYADAEKFIGYKPSYGFAEMLQELANQVATRNM